MTELLNIFKKDSKTDRILVEQMVKRLETAKSPLRMELENTYVSFRTVLTTKDGLVVVGKPPGLEEHIKKGSLVRFKVPETQGKELRLEVVHNHVNLNNGAAVFLCKMPAGFTNSTRQGLRFDTSRLGGLEVLFHDTEDRYKVLDISATGVRLLVPYGDLHSLFPLGEETEAVSLQVKEHQVELDFLVPRAYKGRHVGCEIKASPGTPAHAMLGKLLQYLENNAQKQALG